MKALVDTGLKAGEEPDWAFVNRTLHLLGRTMREQGLDIHPCIEQEVLFALRRAAGLGSAKAVMERFLFNLIPWHPPSNCEATLHNGPSDLTNLWKRSLRDVLSSNGDWRVPQILVCAERRPRWPQSQLIDVHANECSGQAAISPRSVSLVQLDRYDDHPHARADRDPWDLRLRHPVQARGQNPCFLPKPPSCRSVELTELCATLSTCGARENGRWFYIPPDSWNPFLSNAEEWRRGSVFPRGQIGQHHGFIDRDGNVWEWDFSETHWDVQLHDGKHERISHTGAAL